MSDPDQALQQTGDGAPVPARPSIEGVEDALLDGDLSKLNPQQRVSYMKRVCESVGLNPLTKPFRYIRLNGQLTLYATRDAAEQLRKVHGISITDLEETWREDLCIFRARAKDADGRTDVATGAVDTSRSSGQGLANDIMKAETKAKRRVTLSLAGLGWLDETEVSDIPDQATEEVNVDYETGEVRDRKPDKWYEQATESLKDKVREGMDPAQILAYADEAPTSHPIDDWPEEKAEPLIEWLKEGERPGESDSGKAQGHEITESVIQAAREEGAHAAAGTATKEDNPYRNGSPALEDAWDEGFSKPVATETQDTDELKEAADAVEVEGEGANAEEFENGDGVPF